VGDSVTDAEAARQAGVSFVAVLTGTTGREAFAKHAVYEVIETLQCLTDLPTNREVDAK
jgi:phosphoglycolate phosphatase